MLSAKLANAVNNILSAIRRDYYEFSAFLEARIFTLLLAPMGDSQFLYSLRRRFIANKRARFATPGRADVFALLLRAFHANPGNSRFLDSKRRILHSQVRTGNGGNVEAALPKRVEGVKEVLFARRQKLREKHQFQYLENERTFAILGKCSLQLRIFMRGVSQGIEVILPAYAQVDGASNVELAIDRVGNAIDARCVGDRGHVLN